MSNGSEHTPERCVHAVDGPDWAGLRELYPAEVDYEALVEVARARYKLASDEMDRLTAGNPGTNWRWSIPANPDRDSDLILSASVEDVPRLANAVEALVAEVAEMDETLGNFEAVVAERDALQAENVQLRGDLSENRRALDDAINVANGNKIARDALQAEVERMRADLHEWETVGAPAWVAAKDAQIAEVWAERDALQARLDAMTVEWAVHWIPGDTYHDAPTEADAVSLAGEFVRSKAQAVQRLVGPWTVVPEGDTNA